MGSDNLASLKGKVCQYCNGMHYYVTFLLLERFDCRSKYVHVIYLWKKCAYH